ncbi:hypothetical protein ACFOY4_27985 [Actinomadura syzygii]|nr:hypothetical protein [Actinomadura syzygii]
MAKRLLLAATIVAATVVLPAGHAGAAQQVHMTSAQTVHRTKVHMT